jgi:hypothetical protein
LTVRILVDDRWQKYVCCLNDEGLVTVDDAVLKLQVELEKGSFYCSSCSFFQAFESIPDNVDDFNVGPLLPKVKVVYEPYETKYNQLVCRRQDDYFFLEDVGMDEQGKMYATGYVLHPIPMQEYYEYRQNCQSEFYSEWKDAVYYDRTELGLREFTQQILDDRGPEALYDLSFPSSGDLAVELYNKRHGEEIAKFAEMKYWGDIFSERGCNYPVRFWEDMDEIYNPDFVTIIKLHKKTQKDSEPN